LNGIIIDRSDLPAAQVPLTPYVYLETYIQPLTKLSALEVAPLAHFTFPSAAPMTTSNDNRRPLGSQPNHPSYSATPQPDRQQPQPSADSYQSDTIYEIVVSSPMKRFLRAFCVAFFIWFLLSLLLRSIYELAYWSHHHGPYGNRYSYLISVSRALIYIYTINLMVIGLPRSGRCRPERVRLREWVEDYPR